MSYPNRNIQVKNHFLLCLGFLFAAMTILMLFLPDSIIQGIKNFGQPFGVWWLYLVDLSSILFLALGSFFVDKATGGTWWVKHDGG